MPINTAVVFLVHRPSRQKLDEACRYVSSCFLRPAVVVREMEYANLTTRLIGRIQSSAIESFIKYFQYPTEIISRNSTESFFPKKEGIYSQWLLDDNGKFTFCRYYPAYCLLAAKLQK